MWTLVLGVTFGLLASYGSEDIPVTSRSCSYGGVFLVQGATRHSLNFEAARNVCVQLESVLASEAQVKKAYDKKMETCRNGWTNNMTIAILRHSHHANCAQNATGFFIQQQQQQDLYDAYCFDEHAGPEKNCTKEFVLKPAEPSSQPEDPTITGSQEEITSATEPVDVYEKYTVSQNTETPATSETPAVKENPSGGSDNSSNGSTLTTWDDQTAGSGAMATTSEEAPPPTETQTPTDNDQTKETVTIVPQQPPKGEGRVLAPSGVPDQQEGSSANWLVIIAVIAAVAVILLVCAVIAMRKSKTQTLNITSKNGGEGNGAAASASGSHAQEREQEMVTLMNKEKIQENGATEEFTVITLEESPEKEQLA
nr:CD44 antigen-like isoform X1 [Gasterosteus aculeatus aculeatus]